MGKDAELTHDEIRAILIEKIRAAWPGTLPDSLERDIELASIAGLRQRLAVAEVARDMEPHEPKEWEPPEPSPLIPERERELMRRGLNTRTGNENPIHTYVLARDECARFYSGPPWVPFNLWGLHEYRSQHPLITECAAKLIGHPDAEDLWDTIKQRYERPDNIAAQLPVVCANAIADWRTLPKMTPSEYKSQREDLARKARQLATELDRFFLARDPDGQELPGLMDFTQLMTDEELTRFDTAIVRTTGMIVNRARRAAGARELDMYEYDDSQNGTAVSQARMDARLVYELLLKDHEEPDYGYGGVPTLPDMLRRIADQCILDSNDPPLSRPNATNTERNRFAHAVIRYFWTSYQDVSPNIVARVVSIFFAQGITENEVSQMIPKVKQATSALRMAPMGAGIDSEISPAK